MESNLSKLPSGANPSTKSLTSISTQQQANTTATSSSKFEVKRNTAPASWEEAYAICLKYCVSKLQQELAVDDKILAVNKPPAGALKLSQVTTLEHYNQLVNSLVPLILGNAKHELLEHTLHERIQQINELLDPEENLTYDRLLKRLSSPALQTLAQHVNFSAHNLRFMVLVDALFQLRHQINESAKWFWSEDKAKAARLLKYYDSQLAACLDPARRNGGALKLTDAQGKTINRFVTFIKQFLSARKQFIAISQEELKLFSRFGSNLHWLIRDFCQTQQQQIEGLLRHLHASNSYYFSRGEPLEKTYKQFVANFPPELPWIQQLIEPIHDPKYKFPTKLDIKYKLKNKGQDIAQELDKAHPKTSEETERLIQLETVLTSGLVAPKMLERVKQLKIIPCNQSTLDGVTYSGVVILKDLFEWLINPPEEHAPVLSSIREFLGELIKSQGQFKVDKPTKSGKTSPGVWVMTKIKGGVIYKITTKEYELSALQVIDELDGLTYLVITQIAKGQLGFTTRINETEYPLLTSWGDLQTLAHKK
jgi:hypothetical protein